MVAAVQIWEGIKRGELESLRQLYLLYHQDIFAYGRKITRDEQLVEDALQETFISIWKYRLSSAVPSSVRHYVLKIFRNQLLRILKERSATSYNDESPDFALEVSFDEQIIEGEDTARLSAQINQALRKLTNRQREIIYYRFYENLPFEEIAGIMNMQPRATYKLMARALGVLKETFDMSLPGIMLAFQVMHPF